MNTYIAFLRGINVSGHHKVPMAELRLELEKLGYTNVITILNSGNAIFDSPEEDVSSLQKNLTEHLKSVFGFPIPTVVKSRESIEKLLHDNPFKDIEVTKDTRLYISFLWNPVKSSLSLPWISEDRSFRILYKEDNAIISVLDVSVTGTPKAMEALENHFSKEMTTRNWNTIKRIEKKLG